MSFVPVVFGVTASGIPLCQGVVQSETNTLQGTSTTAIHHVSSFNRFEAESWSGEHAEHEHEEEQRRMSLAEDSQAAAVLDQDTPIASSAQFERKRTASLAAALLEGDPQGVPLVHFVQHAGDQPFLETEEEQLNAEKPAENSAEAGETEKVLSDLLLTLRGLQMSAPNKHGEALQRLRELEEELRVAGAVTPADAAVSDAVARALAGAGPGRDVQIRVNQSRHTTTTKTVYETETPGMVGLDTDKVRELHQQMLASLTAGPVDGNAEAGTTQKKETAEEGFTNEDGSVVVSKKMTRVVTTTKTTMPGEGEQTPGE